jgi:hypothetical protein
MPPLHTAGYKPVAQVVSALFFVISELASIEPMYQYSLAWFVALFEDTLAKADKARDLGKRIENLVAHFQYSLYVQVGVLLVFVCLSWLAHLLTVLASTAWPGLWHCLRTRCLRLTMRGTWASALTTWWHTSSTACMCR